MLNRHETNAHPARLLFIVTEDWYFVSHRLPLAVAAQAAGFEVAVATSDGQHGNLIRNAGIRLIPLTLSRRTGNPLSEVIALWRLYRQEKPDIVHHVALKPVMFGALAACLARIPAQINAVAGLGWLFSTSNAITRIIRLPFRWMLGLLLDQTHSLTIVQNPEDMAFLEYSGVSASRLRLIRGAGVDIKVFHPTNPPSSPICIVLVARMLWDKGIGEFIEAARQLTDAGITARFVLVGEPDPVNPSSVPEENLRRWHGQHGIEWLGRRDDIPAVLRTAHIACLPSYYREGLPKSLLEAAACGLPIVTTDSPGCREIVREGSNGLLVPIRDAHALAAALKKLIENEELRHSMGAQSRQRAEREFSLDTVIAQTLALYHEALHK